MIQTNSDGGARGNPGPAGIGVILRKGKKIVGKYSGKIGRATNNVAEYMGLIKSLQLAIEIGEKEVECGLDSELVVKQLLGEYRVKNEKLLELFLRVQKLQEKFDKVKYKHLSRNYYYQRICDDMVNKELGNWRKIKAEREKRK